MKIYSFLALSTAALIVIGFRSGAFSSSDPVIETMVSSVNDNCESCTDCGQNCCDVKTDTKSASCCQSAVASQGADCPCGTGTVACDTCVEDAGGSNSLATSGANASVSDSTCNSGCCQTPSAHALALVSTPASSNVNGSIQEAAGSGTEWTMWGGTTSRNMISGATNINTDFDLRAGKNVAWTVTLGSQTYGNAIVGGGKVLVGTNNGGGYREDKYPAEEDKGVVLCFDEKTGEFLWQLTRDKLTIGRVCDWPLQGICSTPTLEP